MRECGALCKAINENRLKGCFQEFVSLYTSALDIRRKLSVGSREANEPNTHVVLPVPPHTAICHPILRMRVEDKSDEVWSSAGACSTYIHIM